ncbi:MAG: DoxX family protein [Polyangiales bacterium]
MAESSAKLRALHARVIVLGKRLAWLPLLLLRLNMGVLFASSGWGKVHNLAKITGYFETLKIPMPGVNAVVVSTTELVGGALLILGLGTRFAAAPLAFTMIIALITAKRGDIHGFADLASTDEFTYLLVLFALVVLGPGRASLDEAIARRVGEQED